MKFRITKKMCCRISDKISLEINTVVFSLCRDQPPALELIRILQKAYFRSLLFKQFLLKYLSEIRFQLNMFPILLYFLRYFLIFNVLMYFLIFNKLMKINLICLYKGLWRKRKRTKWNFISTSLFCSF